MNSQLSFQKIWNVNKKTKVVRTRRRNFGMGGQKHYGLLTEYENIQFFCGIQLRQPFSQLDRFRSVVIGPMHRTAAFEREGAHGRAPTRTVEIPVEPILESIVALTTHPNMFVFIAALRGQPISDI